MEIALKITSHEETNKQIKFRRVEWYLVVLKNNEKKERERELCVFVWHCVRIAFLLFWRQKICDQFQKRLVSHKEKENRGRG